MKGRQLIASGGGGTPTLAAIRALYTTTLALDAATWSELPAASGTSTTYETGAAVLQIPAGVESSRHAGIESTTASALAAARAIAIRLHQRVAVTSGWQRLYVRAGTSADDCLAVILSGAGSLDLGRLDGGVWTGVAGRGGSSEIRTAWQAGELVLVLRREPTGVAVEARQGATIAAALATPPIAVLTSIDGGAVARADGRYVGLDVETIGPVGATEIAVGELTITLGGPL